MACSNFYHVTKYIKISTYHKVKVLKYKQFLNLRLPYQAQPAPETIIVLYFLISYIQLYKNMTSIVYFFISLRLMEYISDSCCLFLFFDFGPSRLRDPHFYICIIIEIVALKTGKHCLFIYKYMEMCGRLCHIKTPGTKSLKQK